MCFFFCSFLVEGAQVAKRDAGAAHEPSGVKDGGRGVAPGGAGG